MAIPLRRQTTANIASALMDKWFNVHGFPKKIISDNGSGFKSKTMMELASLLGIEMHYTSPYHPQSNGACERLNGTLVNMLASYTNNDNQNRWIRFIPTVTFAYNTSIHSGTGFTPYFLVHGREASIGSDAALSPVTNVLHLPNYVQEMQRDLAYAHQHLADRVREAADAREKVNDELKSLAVFNHGDQVLVYSPPKSGDGLSKKLMSPYHGPFTVVRQTSRVTYSLRNNHTNKKTVAHVTLIKPFLSRPAHLLIPGNVALPTITENPDHSVIADPAPHGISENTRARARTRNHPQIPVLSDMEQTYNPTAYPSDGQDKDEDEVEEEDTAPPDEELEEGEVPMSEILARGI